MKILPQIKIDKDFAEKTKMVYLKACREKIPFIKESRRSIHYFAIGFASGMSLILIISGSAVYADQKDVGVNSLLYPMKRIYESVNLNLSGQSEKPVLQAEFAGRRLNEIENIKNKDLDNSKVESLLKDLERSVKESITVLPAQTQTFSSPPAPAQPQPAQPVPVQPSQPTSTAPTITQQLQKQQPQQEIVSPTASSATPAPATTVPTAVCQSLNKLFEHDSAYLGVILKGNSEYLERFENNCESVIGKEGLKRIYEKQQENIRRAEELERNEMDNRSGSNSGSNGEARDKERRGDSRREDGDD